jgi:hypothetical protein
MPIGPVKRKTGTTGMRGNGHINKSPCRTWQIPGSSKGSPARKLAVDPSAVI